MTVTISRLYDRYSDAQSAVRSLEAAGVPHSDISIVANNSDNWFSTDKKVDRDRDGTDDRAEGAGKVPASALALEARLVCSRALVCLLFPVWVRWLPPAGLPQRLSVLQRVLPREGLWELSRKRASRKKRRHCTPKASAAEERWFPLA